MGKYQSGILGSFDGKVGTVVGSRWKGIDYMRSRGRKSSKPPTRLQQEVRVKFGLVTKFIHKFGKLFINSYKPTPKMTGINVAFQHVSNEAITGVFSDYTIDYSKVKISGGEVPLPTSYGDGK
jgi:hypothetical protein